MSNTDKNNTQTTEILDVAGHAEDQKPKAGSKGFFNTIKAFFAKLFESFKKIFGISASEITRNKPTETNTTNKEAGEKAQEEAGGKAQEEAERKAQEEAERKAQEEAKRKAQEIVPLQYAYDLVQTSKKAYDEYNIINNNLDATYAAKNKALKKYSEAHITAISALEIIAEKDIQDLINEAERAKKDALDTPTDFAKAQIATENENKVKTRLKNITEGLYGYFSDKDFETALEGLKQMRNSNNATNAYQVDSPTTQLSSQRQESSPTKS